MPHAALHHNMLFRIPDWPALVAIFNHWLLLAASAVISVGALIFPALSEIEAWLTRIPIWANAITSVFGVVFLGIKHWQQISAWNQRRRLRRQARRLRQ